MKFEEYKSQVKKYFSEISKLSEEEVNNYFSEPETLENLKDGYRAYEKSGSVGNPKSEASNLLMEY